MFQKHAGNSTLPKKRKRRAIIIHDDSDEDCTGTQKESTRSVSRKKLKKVDAKSRNKIRTPEEDIYVEQNKTEVKKHDVPETRTKKKVDKKVKKWCKRSKENKSHKKKKGRKNSIDMEIPTNQVTDEYSMNIPLWLANISGPNIVFSNNSKAYLFQKR